MNDTAPRTVKYIDLFCGLGAFHTAFDRYNAAQGDIRYECVMASDIDPGVRGVYAENYGLEPLGDINEVDLTGIPDFDVLCAGFPCQPFSKAGKLEGFEDKVKGNLFYKILDIVDAKRPGTLMLENVKNLRRHDDGETFRVITQALEQRGYTVSYRVLDSRYYGSPQSRQRIYIVCTTGEPYEFRDVRQDIVPVSTIIDRSVETHCNYEAKYVLRPCPGREMMKYKLFNRRSGRGGRQGERVYDIDKCGPTVCASSGGLGAKTGLYEIGDRIRTLTVMETLQMFGFDVSFRYASLKNPQRMLFYLGNSIVVNVLEELVKDL